MAGNSSRVALTNAVIALVVLIAAGVATWLLVRTLNAANAISDDAARVAALSRSINSDTDAVRGLQRTVRIADAILGDARPLDGQLHDITTLSGSIDSTAGAVNSTAHNIDGTARSIERLAAAIDSTSGAIDHTAGRVNGIASGIHGTARNINGIAGHIDGRAEHINSHAAHIATTSRKVDRDASRISTNLDGSIALVKAILGDAGVILTRTIEAHQHAACIDREVAGRDGADGHCDSLRKDGT